MSIPKYKIAAIIILVFLAGIIIGQNWFWPWQYIFIFLAPIIFFLFKLKKFWLYSLVNFMLFAGAGYFLLFNYFGVPKNLPYGQTLNIHGVVCSEPQASATSQKLTVCVLGSKSYRILAIVSKERQFCYGDELLFEGKLEKPEKFEDFDYPKYLASKKIFALVRNPTNLEIIAYNQGNIFYGWIFTIKEKFENAIGKVLPEPHASLAQGLLLGGSSMSNDLKADFAKTGTSHIVAISGFNISVIIKIFHDGLLWILPRSLAFYFGLIGVGAFVILTGASASVVRAAIMGSLFLLAKQLGRRSKIVVSLLVSALVMILINPYILQADLGFQFSFLSVLGLIYLAPIFEKKILQTRFIKKIPYFLVQIFAATVAAQIMVLPLSIKSFDQFSVIAPIVNVLVLPVIYVAMLFSFMAGFGTIISIWFGKLLAGFAWVVLQYMLVLVNWFAKMPYASLSMHINNIAVLGYYLIMGWFLILYYRFKRENALNE